MLHLRLLGPLAVSDDQGNDLTPQGPRERACLATLAILAPEPLSTERLASELYRETETSDPRNAVQAVVSRLRKALGRSAGSVETTANGYRIVDVRLDLDEAEELLRAALATTDADESARLLDEAVAVWDGSTLDGLDGEVVDAERTRLDGLRADATDAVFERVLASETTSALDVTVINRLEAAVRDQPLRERRWELLMLALYRHGRQADALRAFQRARTLLLDHLGLEPGPALTTLEARILAHDPTLPAALPAQPSATSESSASPEASATPESSATPDPLTASGVLDDETGEEATLPSGTLSLVLCDVEGSVGRWEAAPDETALDIATLHEIWSSASEDSGGLVVKSTGDGVLAVFKTAGAAVSATVDAMRRQAATGLSVRAAIHTGSMEPTGHDYRGPIVNRCARLLDLANGGQILITATTADLARPELHDEITLRDLGTQWLRDVPDPMSVWQVGGPGLRSDFPALQSQGPDSLPRLRTGLFGRDDLVDDVVEQVGDQPLVTLLGPGGIGKTSVALATAWKLLASRPITFVDLARVTEGAAVAHRIADDLAPADHEDGRRPALRIADRLRVSTDLVIIDNAEHVLDAVAVTLDDVLSHQLKGSFLVTTRQPLGLSGESIVAVPPLALPNDAADLDTTGRSPSVQLFVDRARTTRPDFAVPSGLLPVVAHICRRLDGIPLAIELAAGRASLLSIEDIASRLDDQLRLLRQVRTSRERRHRSLEAVVGWSAEQLSTDGRELFSRLSVMAGSFGIDGVEQLLGHCGLAGIDALDGLDELHGASLLVVEESGSRFKMLEPIRQMAAAELVARGLETETRIAHARWLIDVLQDAHRRRDESRAIAYKALDLEGDQLAAAITWVAESAARELVGALSYYGAWWYIVRDARTGERLLGELLAVADRDADAVGWAQAVMGLGVASAAHPRSDVSESSIEALAIFDELQHPDAGLLRVIVTFAQTGRNDLELPQRLLSEAEQLVSSDDAWASAVVDMACLTMSSIIDVLAPDPGIDPTANRMAAVARGERAAATFRRLDEGWALGVTLSELGRVHQRHGEIEAAERCYIESVELFSSTDYHGVHYVLTEIGRLMSAKGNHTSAERYHQQAHEIAQEYANPGCVAMSLAGLADAAAARNDEHLAIDLYRQAVDLADGASMLEHGYNEWLRALASLEAENPDAVDEVDSPGSTT